MYVFTQKISSALAPTLTLALTAEERTRSRYRYRVSREITDNAPPSGGAQPGIEPFEEIYLELPRGTALHHGDCLGGDEHQQILKIVSKPEPVLTVRASTGPQSSNAPLEASLQLMRAAYHLGNRHVALEVGSNYLRLTPDSVLESMLHQLGVTITAETMPFQPESGAYGHHH
ncbi:MAG: urease accessory protein UreE [Cyanobacteria bacterium P01_D01_bin.56]